MNKLSVKGTLALCSTFALLTVASTTVLADSSAGSGQQMPPTTQLATPAGEQVATTVDRQITVVNPLNGDKAVVTQTATTTPDPDGTDSNIWQVYFPLVYQGYKPSQPFVPVTVVTPETQPSNIEITYRPLKQGDIRTNTFAGIFFKDVHGKQVGPMLCQPVDKKGLVQMPEAPAGWEYINRNQLPDSFICFDYRDPFYVFLVKKAGERPAEQVQTKQLTRKIVCHLPGGDKIYEQTVTAKKVGTQPWEAPAFPEFSVPVSTGYRPSASIIQAQAADADQPLLLVEVTYQPIKTVGPTTSDESLIPLQPGSPIENNQPIGSLNNVASDEKSMTFPDLKDRLEQLQAPLKQLENNEQASQPGALPQTGNHAEKSSTAAGLVIAAWTALSGMFSLKKKLNNFK